MKISNELKTGAVIFTALAVFLVLMVKTGDIAVGKKGYTLSTHVAFAAGVKKYAPVRLSGVEVGEIRDLTLIYEPERTVVRADIWVREDVKIRKDSLALVSTLGMMGEKYIEIKAGVSPEFVGPGGTIEGKDPVSLEDLMEEFRAVGDELKGTLVDARKMINNVNGVLDENKAKISRMMDNLESTTEYFNEFAEDVKHHPWKVLAKGKEMTPAELERSRAERLARRQALVAQQQAAAAAASGETAPAAPAAAPAAVPAAAAPAVEAEKAPATRSSNFAARKR